jgi:hypothetical protein
MVQVGLGGVSMDTWMGLLASRVVKVRRKKEREVGRMWIAFHIVSSSYLVHLVARHKFNSRPDPSIHPFIIPPHRACATSVCLDKQCF